MRDAKQMWPEDEVRQPFDVLDTSAKVTYSLPEIPEIVARDGEITPASEQFRRLANYVQEPALAPTQVIVVTSPIPGDGKSFVAINLALALARSGPGDTLLVDGDLRRDGISSLVAPKPALGLATLLADGARIEDAPVRLDRAPLWFLASGSTGADPVNLITAARFGSVITRLRKRFARIVIDTAPVVPFGDAAVIGGHSDGVLLVVRAGSTPKALFEESVELLGGTRLLGVTLNGAVRSLLEMGRGYDDYHRAYYARPAKISS